MKQLGRFEGRVFVNSGRDEETGAFPFVYDFSSFVTQTRSVFQYALKEINERGMRRSYDTFIERRPIVGFFTAIRDTDIHEYIPNIHTTITGASKITRFDPTTGIGVGAPLHLCVESLDDINSPKRKHTNVIIKTTVMKRVESNSILLQKWTEEGRIDLVTGAEQGRPIYEQLEFEGEDNIFELCRSFLSSAEDFFAYAVKEGLIA